MNGAPEAEIAMTRSRVHALIDACEADLRNALAEWVAPFVSESELLGPYEEKVLTRSLAEDANPGAVSRLLDFLDFQDGFSLLNIHRHRLPEEIARLIRDFTPRLEGLVPIRNRVMHGLSHPAIAWCG